MLILIHCDDDRSISNVSAAMKMFPKNIDKKITTNRLELNCATIDMSRMMMMMMENGELLNDFDWWMTFFW